MTTAKPPLATSPADTRRRDPRLLTRVPALDGVRGIAVLLVVALHIALLMPSLHRVTKGGYLGVDAFFVLSGFLITALLLREQTLQGRIRIGAFYRRRALRLLPALTVLLCAQVIYGAYTHAAVGPERESVASVLFYYSNTWLLRTPILPGLGGLWSLAVEEQFYMVWPLVFLLFLGLRRRLSTTMLVTTALIVAVCVNRAILFQDGRPVLDLYTRTITRADALLVGALLAQIWVRGRLPKRGLIPAAWIALAFFAYAVGHTFSDAFLYRGGYTLIAIALAVILLAVLETSWSVNRVLQLRPLRAVGRISYGIYIWHLFIIFAVARVSAGWTTSTRLTVGLGLCAVASYGSWMLVERPFLAWKEGLEAADGRARTAPRVAFGVVAAALVVGTLILVVSDTGPSAAARAAAAATTRIPSVAGMSTPEAETRLTEAHLRPNTTTPSAPGDGTVVVSQSPVAGTTVRRGTIVHLVVGDGPQG